MTEIQGKSILVRVIGSQLYFVSYVYLFSKTQKLPPPYQCVYHPGRRFSLAHKNPGVHGADPLSFSGALCYPLPLFEPHQVVILLLFSIIYLGPQT